MAFENLTKQILARADEIRDPGSGDAYLRLTTAGDRALKLSAICLLSEAVYRDGSELAPDPWPPALADPMRRQLRAVRRVLRN